MTIIMARDGTKCKRPFRSGIILGGVSVTFVGKRTCGTTTISAGPIFRLFRRLFQEIFPRIQRYSGVYAIGSLAVNLAVTIGLFTLEPAQ